MPARRIQPHVEEEESYFVSMTDVVIGLLFIFIIMLMFFAMRFQEATKNSNDATQQQRQATELQREATQKQDKVTQKQEDLIKDLTSSDKARADILASVASAFQRRGVTVFVLRDEGILRLPEDILFDSASWEVKPKGIDALKILGDALDQILPCFTHGTRSVVSGCPDTKARIEAIFVEGHADSTPYRRTPTPVVPPDDRRNRPQKRSQSDQPSSFLQSFRPFRDDAPDPQAPEPRRPAPFAQRDAPPRDNLDLSALRATGTFRELIRVKPELASYNSPNGTPVLSVSSYGEHRPLKREPGESNDIYNKRNRRIDVRILMATPRSEDAQMFQRGIIGAQP